MYQAIPSVRTKYCKKITICDQINIKNNTLTRNLLTNDMKLPRLKHTKNNAQIDSEMTSIAFYLIDISAVSLFNMLTFSASTA